MIIQKEVGDNNPFWCRIKQWNSSGEMVELEYCLGDVVKLRSGGPLMTLVHIGGDEMLTCEWFADDGSVRRRAWPALSLKCVIAASSRGDGLEKPTRAPALDEDSFGGWPMRFYV